MTAEMESVRELHTYLAAFRKFRRHLLWLEYSLSAAVGETEAALEQLSLAITEYNQVPVPTQFASVHHLTRQAAVAQEAALEYLVKVLRLSAGGDKASGENKVEAEQATVLADRAVHHLENALGLLAEALHEFQMQLLELDARVISRAWLESITEQLTTVDTHRH